MKLPESLLPGPRGCRVASRSGEWVGVGLLMHYRPRGVLEAHTRKNRRVSEADYREYNPAHMFALSRVENLLRKTSLRPLPRPQVSIPARLQPPQVSASPTPMC